jgi:PAS domain-containing protein
VVDADANRFMFDYRELKRFGISMQQLPEGSLVINQPPPFYALSRGQLLAGLGLMTGLAAFLLVDVRLRIRAQRTLRAEKERVDLLLNSTAEAIYGVDPEGRCTFCNPATLRLLGYLDEKELLGKNLHALNHPHRPDGGPSIPPRSAAFCKPFGRMRVCMWMMSCSGGQTEPASRWSTGLTRFVEARRRSERW